MIRIVNLRNYKPVDGEILIKVDRSSILGNPFYMHYETERNEVCDKYENYFNRIVNLYLNCDDKLSPHDMEFIRILSNIIRLAKIDNIALGCWCYPKRCHAETIKKYIEKVLNTIKLL